MKTFLKILLVPIALIVGIFLYGFFGAMFGFYDPPPESPKTIEQTETNAPPLAQPVPSVQNPGPAVSLPGLPSNLTARSAMEYLNQNELVFLKAGQISVSDTRFSSLGVTDAASIYAAFSDHEPAKDFETARLIFFAGCADLPEAARDAFLSETGGIFQKDGFLDDPEWGDFFSLMFGLGASDLSPELRPIYARGVQNYLAVMEENEVISVLKDMDIIQTYTTNTKADEWRVRTERRLDNFDPSTLVAIFEKIGTKGRNRQRLRDALKYQIDRVQSDEF